jgi:anti-sigma factor ChrR (cupin superfamily)
MKLHANLSKRAIAFSNEIPWVDSPMPGVQRRMLERDGEEVARATSIVRYAAGSYFSSHTHGGGEEFLVLEGVFSDERGNYPAGTYVRNPVGSTHTPSSQNGCTILVKLWQMHPDDQQRVVVDTTQSDWLSSSVDGLQIMPLHHHGTEKVALMKWASGAHFQRPYNEGGEEIFVLDGEFEDEIGTYPKGTWIRNPDGTPQTSFTREGCLIYCKTGHLFF